MASHVMATSEAYPRRWLGPSWKPQRGRPSRRAGVTKRARAALRRTVFARDENTCVACRGAVDPDALDELRRAHPHHIIPRSLASKAIKDTTANVCTVCPTCHADLGQKTLFIAGDADQRLTIWRTG